MKKNTLLKKIAKTGELTAEKASGLASLFLLHQPKEPKQLQK